MKITRLDIQGFRSLKNVSWQPGDLNVVIGPNASGKSNLLKALEMLSAAAAKSLREWIDNNEGGFSRLLWDGTAPGIQFELTLTELSKARSYTHSLFLQEDRFYGGHKIETEVLRESTPKESEVILKREKNNKFFERTSSGNFAPLVLEHPKLEETLLSQKDSVEALFFIIKLMSWNIFLEFNTHRGSSVRLPTPTRLSRELEPDGENFVQFLHTTYSEDRDFKRSLNDAMRAAFGDDFEELVFSPAYENRVLLGIRWKSLKRHQTSQDLSDGTLRFLFIIAALANPNPPPLIAIDEPETGLHPSMLPIIAEYAQEAAMKTQVIFTTHSVEFLDAFQGTPPTVTVATWADGETKLEIIDGEKLAYWLQDYTLGNLFRTGTLEGMVQ